MVSKNNQEKTEAIALVLKNLEVMRERTEQIANAADSFRFCIRLVQENVQSAFITGDTDDLLRHWLLPSLIVMSARVFGELANGIEDVADQLDDSFQNLSDDCEEE